MILLLSAIIYDLTTLMGNKRYFIKLGEGLDYARITIFDLFANICLYCNYLQGLNGLNGQRVDNSKGYMYMCKQLKINPNKAYSHTVKHRYTNFDLGDLEINMFEESRPFYVIGESIL